MIQILICSLINLSGAAELYNSNKIKPQTSSWFVLSVLQRKLFQFNPDMYK